MYTNLINNKIAGSPVKLSQASIRSVTAWDFSLVAGLTILHE
jgi:hypothetical protein